MNTALIYINNEKVVNRGVGYLMMAIEKAGHHVDFYDTAWYTDYQVIDKIIYADYDLLMISASSVYVDRLRNITRKVKREKEISILVGGIHATIEPHSVLEDPNVDFVCIGEGEDFIVEFLDKFYSIDVLTIDNLGWCDITGRIYINDRIRPPTDLTRLKPFNYSFFHPKSVVPEGQVVDGLAYVSATRGCPYRCTYCCNDSWIDLYSHEFLRTHPIDDVIEELKRLKSDYPVKFLYFGDEMILFDRKYCTELFRKVSDEIQLPYGCMVRVETINQEIIDLFRHTGCGYVGMGVECGDQDFRREWLNRKMTNEQIVDTFKSLKSIPGMKLTSFNMRGWPVSYDHKLTQATLELNRILSPNFVQMTWFCPFPGTILGDYCRHHGLVDEEKMASAGDVFSQSFLKDIPEGLPTLKEYEEDVKNVLQVKDS